MKIRNGFISNSSSSSFIIDGLITRSQLDTITKYPFIIGSGWHFHMKDDKLIGITTSCDFTKMKDYLINSVGINELMITWEHD